MPEFAISTTVRGSPEEVFDAFTDLEGAPRRIPGIVRIEKLTEGPVGAGTHFRETRIMFRKEATEEMEITEFDRPRGYAVECHSCGCAYRTTFTFRPEGHSTMVESRTSCRAVSFLAKLFAPLGALMLGSMKKCMERDLQQARESIEGAEGRPAGAAARHA